MTMTNDIVHLDEIRFERRITAVKRLDQALQQLPDDQREPALQRGISAVKERRSGGDPIFAAIERHRAAQVALDAAETDAPRDVDAAFYAAEKQAMTQLCSTRPSTAAGCAAALRYIAAASVRDGDGLFAIYHEACTVPGAAAGFLPMIADAIEAQAKAVR